MENTLRRKQRLGRRGNFPTATGDITNYLGSTANAVKDLINDSEYVLLLSSQSEDADSELQTSPTNGTDGYEVTEIHWAEPQPFAFCASYEKCE